MIELLEFRIEKACFDKRVRGVIDLDNINIKEFSRVVSIKINSSDKRIVFFKDLYLQIKKSKEFYFDVLSPVRKYSKNEIKSAENFRIIFNNYLEISGEEHGTKFDTTNECKFCGSFRNVDGAYIIDPKIKLKKDVYFTLDGQILVSDKFKDNFSQFNTKEFSFINTNHKNLYLLNVINQFLVFETTKFGLNYFDDSNESLNEKYICPFGHTLGLNINSELFLFKNQFMFLSKSTQTIGIKRGLLRPKHIFIGSNLFYQKFNQENLTGLSFEIAHICA